MFARQKQAARQAERIVEVALERRLEPPHVHAEIAQQALCDVAPFALRRIDRLAAAVADHQAAVDHELVALGVAAEIIVIVKNKNTRLGTRGAAIEPRSGKSADTTAHDYEVVAFFCRQGVDGKACAVARKFMCGLERAGVLAA